MRASCFVFARPAFILLCLVSAARLALPFSTSAEPSIMVTNVAQLSSLNFEKPEIEYSIRIEGDVWWVNPAEGQLVLHDASGTAELEIDWQAQSVQVEDRVRLEGSGNILRKGAAFRIGIKGPVVDNDGIHTMTEMSGAVFLARGRQPLRLDWFNGVGKSGLSVEYEGPGLQRQKVPGSALFRDAAGDGVSEKGLAYRSYEGSWEMLPDFEKLTTVKSGNAANFDLNVRTRDRYVGLQFSGFIEVPRDGLYRFHLKSDDGSRLFVGKPTLQLTMIGRSALPSPEPTSVGQLLSEENGRWSEVEGKVTIVRKQAHGTRLELRSAGGAMRVEVADDSGLTAETLLNRRIRTIGFCQSSFTLDGEKVAGVLLVSSARQIRSVENLPGEQIDSESNLKTNSLPILTAASSVRALGPQEARRGYPIRVRGVVTCVQSDRNAFVVQDATAGLYVLDLSNGYELPRVGEFLEVEAITDEPGIARARELKHLGEGSLPDPVRPVWDQLLNGSLDSQWVELGGFVESIVNRSNGWSRVNLRTRAGVLKVDLRRAGIRPQTLEHYENAAIRLRGCMFADWLPDLRLKVGQIRMYDADVIVDQPAPENLYSVPSTTAAALMRFDPAFDVSHRVKVSGQVVYVRGGTDYFMMDGSDGLRFLPGQSLGLEAGDVVEVVGFPELSGAAPVLRGAVARKTGHTALPEPVKLKPSDLFDTSHDSTRVQVQGQLASVRQTVTNEVLEVQAESWRFLARLNSKEQASGLRIGSKLALTGVYCAQGGYAALGQDVAPIDLLLNSPADIRVLAQPSWWTLQRLLVVVGVLVIVVAGMVLWITQLHRVVDERTTELKTQVQNRERVEQQRAIDQERTRIAQDLHDELGSDITEIGMLAARARSISDSDEERGRYLEQMADKARQMVAALEEIVWAMNPMRDTLGSLVSYFCFYAERFLGLANIKWKFEGNPGRAEHTVESRVRHQLFLIFKEALANVVNHSGATEVRLSVEVKDTELRLTIADNGSGILLKDHTAAMNGIANMKARIEELGGTIDISSEAGGGTTLRFAVPSNEEP
jgi:signal transduction histidine kinase